MPLLNSPANVNSYFMPADATPAKAALIAAINAAATKIRIAMFALSDPQLLAALVAAQTRGVTNIMLALDWSQAHMHWEHQAIAHTRQILSPAKMVYTTSSVNHVIMHNKLCTIDDTITIIGSLNWTPEAWIENNVLHFISDATLATAASAVVDAAAAYGLAHLPQT